MVKKNGKIEQELHTILATALYENQVQPLCNLEKETPSTIIRTKNTTTRSEEQFYRRRFRTK